MGYYPNGIGDQIGAGYALETYLQGEGIGYFVIYSFRPYDKAVGGKRDEKIEIPC